MFWGLKVLKILEMLEMLRMYRIPYFFGQENKSKSDFESGFISDFDLKLLKLKDESDVFLTDEIKAGNDDAFKILVERYGYIIAYNISNMSAAYPGTVSKMSKWYGSDKEDLYQECCIVLYKAAKYYDLMRNVKFSTYANICVKNYLVSLFRKYGKYCKANCELISFDVISESEYGICDQYFIFRDFADYIDFGNIPLVAEIMSNPKNSKNSKILTDFERRVFLMYIERKSYKYIAKMLNKNIKSIDNAICRIKTKLKPYAKSFMLDY